MVTSYTQLLAGRDKGRLDLGRFAARKGLDLSLHGAQGRGHMTIATDTQGDTIRVLLVEDNAGDVRLTREAFKDAKVLINLYVASDGLDAMNFLNREGEYSSAPRPDLILLDLNLPKKSGREVLEEIKGNPKLMNIPVVILSTSSAAKDILESYRLHANCYISKPVDLAGFLTVVKSIDNFWLTVVKLPHE